MRTFPHISRTLWILSITSIKLTKPILFLPTLSFFSADVTSLYTNSQHADGLKATCDALNSRSNPCPPTNQLVRLLELVFTLKTFQFNGIHYLQTQGTAMGTSCTPSYANLMMGALKKNLLTTDLAVSCITWKRFIDDCFFTWTGSNSDFLLFQEYLNSAHNTIKFTFDSSHISVPFLDTKVEVLDNKLVTQLFRAPNDAHLYLLPSSYHPRHTLSSINPYSQRLRIKRICSNNTDAQRHLYDLSDHLQKRGYNQDIITSAFGRAENTSREDLLKYKVKDKNPKLA